MRTLINMILILLAVPVIIMAQQSSFQDSLLENLAGEWIMEGTIAGQEVVHDVSVSWILEHQYLQIKEKSREKDPDGTAAYEALVLIGWNADLNKYACMWLDVTGGGGLIGDGIGHAAREGNKLPFLFKMGDGMFHNTFEYIDENDTWTWKLDSEKDGILNPFARVTLSRKQEL